jgi:hypothetical protein
VIMESAFMEWLVALLVAAIEGGAESEPRICISTRVRP